MHPTTPNGLNIVVYDLETKNPVEGAVTWNRKDLMGISVGVAFHYLTMEFKVFMDDNLEELVVLLEQADIVSGFNIVSFDNELINATAKEKYTKQNSYDMLIESRLAFGWLPELPYPKGMRLDDHLFGTFGEDFMKTADGAQAPVMYQNKQLGKLVSYCIDDVKRECMLFEHVWSGQKVTTQLHGPRLLVHPWERFKAFKQPPVEAQALPW